MKMIWFIQMLNCEIVKRNMYTGLRQSTNNNNNLKTFPILVFPLKLNEVCGIRKQYKRNDDMRY